MPEKSSFQKLHHVGVVVKDIHKAIAHFESLGIGPFGAPGGQKTFAISFNGELHGKPASWTTTISNARIGVAAAGPVDPDSEFSIQDSRGMRVHHSPDHQSLRESHWDCLIRAL